MLTMLFLSTVQEKGKLQEKGRTELSRKQKKKKNFFFFLNFGGEEEKLPWSPGTRRVLHTAPGRPSSGSAAKFRAAAPGRPAPPAAAAAGTGPGPGPPPGGDRAPAQRRLGPG